MPRVSLQNSFLIAALSVLLLGSVADAGTEKVLHSFSIADGDVPYGGVVFDASGNLFGTTFYGGSTNCNGAGCGVVFKLTPAAGGSWAESTIYAFTGAADGSHPYSSLLFDAAGNLYGATYGAYDGGTGFGTVFKLTPGANGSWSFSLLHTFEGGKDGAQPNGSLALDSAGNLYGTTFTGGSYDAGVAFELTPTTGGRWRETLLHTFTGGQDGYGPSGLLLDVKGNLYGATPYGSVAGCGDNSCGVVFRLSPTANHGWTDTILHRFTGSDGEYPSSLAFDASGNLYGAAAAGGNCPYCFGGCGVVFELTPGSGNVWRETDLHSFDGGGGQSPDSLLFGDGARVRGSAYSGGLGEGLIFELDSDTGWTENVLYQFSGDSDGGGPVGPIVADRAGNLYGTALRGGPLDSGVVFEVTP